MVDHIRLVGGWGRYGWSEGEADMDDRRVGNIWMDVG
jgi:hypothetical protein